MTVKSIDGVVKDGMIITVQGFLPANCNRFSINLNCGPVLNASDNALHVNPRFDNNCVVRNSFQNGSWKNEERSGYGLPVQRYAAFESIILVQHDQFMVSFNGCHFCEFRHRLPKERVTHVIIDGDVQVNNVAIVGAGTMIVKPIGSLVRDGMVITVQGSIPGHCNRFSINLCCGPVLNACDNALHVNPRFDNNCVVRNTYQNGSWQQEERTGYGLPVHRGAAFESIIIVQEYKILVLFGGRYFCEFRHRLPKERVTHVIIDGDVQVNDVIISGP